jgi:integrase
MASIHVEVKPNGERRYVVRYRTPDKKHRKRRFRRRPDAERFRNAIEHSKAEGMFVDPKAGRQTFADFAERWLATKVDVRPRTLVNLEGRLRNHILPTFGRRPIGSITPEEVREWVAALVATGLSADTVKAVFLTASQVFDTAEVDRVIGRSPCIPMRRKLPKPKVRAEILYLDDHQVEALAEVIEPRYRALVIMAAYTGARAGELEALRVERVNWLRRRFHIVETLSEVHGELRIGGTKTWGSTRWVPMPSFVVDVLREHIDAYPSSDRLVFTSAEGGPLRHRNFMARHFKPAVKAAGLPSRLRFHDLRHTAAAFMIAEGASMEQVKQILGHSTIRVTSDTYGHLFEDHADPLMAALDARRQQGSASKTRPNGVVTLPETRISAGRNRR